MDVKIDMMKPDPLRKQSPLDWTASANVLCRFLYFMESCVSLGEERERETRGLLCDHLPDSQWTRCGHESKADGLIQVENLREKPRWEWLYLEHSTLILFQFKDVCRGIGRLFPLFD